MALQDGFKVLGLDIMAPGTGYGDEDTEGVLTMRAPATLEHVRARPTQ